MPGCAGWSQLAPLRLAAPPRACLPHACPPAMRPCHARLQQPNTPHNRLHLFLPPQVLMAQDAAAAAAAGCADRAQRQVHLPELPPR